MQKITVLPLVLLFASGLPVACAVTGENFPISGDVLSSLHEQVNHNMLTPRRGYMTARTDGMRARTEGLLALRTQNLRTLLTENLRTPLTDASTPSDLIHLSSQNADNLFNEVNANINSNSISNRSNNLIGRRPQRYLTPESSEYSATDSYSDGESFSSQNITSNTGESFPDRRNKPKDDPRFHIDVISSTNYVNISLYILGSLITLTVIGLLFYFRKPAAKPKKQAPINFDYKEKK